MTTLFNLSGLYFIEFFFARVESGRKIYVIQILNFLYLSILNTRLIFETFAYSFYVTIPVTVSKTFSSKKQNF